MSATSKTADIPNSKRPSSPPSNLTSNSSSLSSASLNSSSSSENKVWTPGSYHRPQQDNETKEIIQFLEEAGKYSPTVPEAIVQRYLQLGGASVDDPKLLRLVALATDRFLAGVVKNAKELGELRVGDKRPSPALSMEDVAESLRNKGVKITRPSSSSSTDNDR